MCYYFHDITEFMNRDSDFDFNYILSDEKKDENILVYGISYKTSANAKPLCIRLKKIDGVIKTHDKIRCLLLFHYG